MEGKCMECGADCALYFCKGCIKEETPKELIDGDYLMALGYDRLAKVREKFAD